MNFLLVLNPKHNSYWKENWLYPVETRTYTNQKDKAFKDLFRPTTCCSHKKYIL